MDEADTIAASTSRQGRLIIVCGLPGAGKTTLARQLEDASAGIRMCPDEWMADLGIDVYDSTARDRVEQLQWRLAQRLLQLGHVVIIEWGTWGKDEREALRLGARALGAVVELRFVDETVDVLWQRVRNRGMEQALGGRPLTYGDVVSSASKIQRPDANEFELYDAPLT